MFQLNRYNPEGETSKKNKQEKRKKKKEKKDSRQQPVIAEEQPEPKKPKLAGYEESIDDLINDEFVAPHSSESEKNHSQQQSSSSHLNESEIQEALQMAKQPLLQVAREWNLAPFLVENLQRDGFDTFFPIQALTIPDVITTERNPHLQVRDICVAAPTGSGKTLAYVLPILNSLSHRSGGSRKLRALIVLPSRELAVQVFQVVQRYLTGSHTLRVGIATGQSPLVAEQRALTMDESSSLHTPAVLHTLLTHYEPGNLNLALQLFQNDDDEPTTIPHSGWSNVDILVCTPGRLLDHLDNTPGFTLQHLRYLVVDEADRLLGQSYNNWIDRILEATEETPAATLANTAIDPITLRHGPTAVQLRKFLVSATLTRDPQKLASLRLLNPKHFDVHLFHDQANKYTMPDSLEEFVVECTAEQKPLVLMSLLRDTASTENKVIIFTSRLDSTHRLARLLQLAWTALGLEDTCIGEFSGALGRNDRTAFLERCNNPHDNLSVIVCSDAMSRGMDIRVDTAINYDVPILAKTYVHRCGRTARASRRGEAITLVKGGQMAQFTRMRELVRSPDRVRTMRLQKEPIQKLLSVYQISVDALRRVVDTESRGELRTKDSVRSFVDHTSETSH